MTSEWRDVPGCAGYQVSADGLVRNAATGRVLTGFVDRYGYRVLNIAGRAKKKAHRLVCEAYHGPAPDGREVAHLDGDPSNNRADNLAWVTRKENAAHKRLHDTNYGNGGMPGEANPSARLSISQVEVIRGSSLSSRKLAAEFGVSQAQIVRIKNGQRWRAA